MRIPIVQFVDDARTLINGVIYCGGRLPNTLQDVYYSTDFNELTDQTTVSAMRRSPGYVCTQHLGFIALTSCT